jgi:hypothetical protein
VVQPEYCVKLWFAVLHYLIVWLSMLFYAIIAANLATNPLRALNLAERNDGEPPGQLMRYLLMMENTYAIVRPIPFILKREVLVHYGFGTGAFQWDFLDDSMLVTRL